MPKYDFLIVGAGLFGSTFAHLATKSGKRCLVIDKRPHVGGNLYCKQIEGINVHVYGAHIFHTSDKEVWDFVNSLTTCAATHGIFRRTRSAFPNKKAAT